MKNKYLIMIIVILSLLIVILSGIIVYDKQNNTNKEENKTTTTTTTTTKFAYDYFKTSYYELNNELNKVEYLFNRKNDKVYLDIVFNNKKIKSNILNNGENINDKSATIINNSYLVFEIEEEVYDSDPIINPFIINSNGKIIYEFNFPKSYSANITDETSNMYNKGMYYINDNKIYYIECNRSDGTYTYFDEYMLEISNDKVNKTFIGNYKGIGAGAKVC